MGGGGASGLGGLHVAMGAGRLDPYRAGVVAEELEAAPAQVRATVVTLLEPYLGWRTGRTCGGGVGGRWRGSARTCCVSGR